MGKNRYQVSAPELLLWLFVILFFISLASEGKYKCAHGLKLEQYFYDPLFA